MKLTEANQSEKICPFCSLSLEAKIWKRKEAKKLIFSLSDQNTCETDFLLLFEAKLAHPTSECSRNSDRL